MALSAVLMFTASMFLMNNNANPVSAEGEAVVFEMATDVQVRMDVPAGLRFRATFNDAAKAEIDESKMFGFAIAPAAYFEATEGDYNQLDDGVMAELDKDALVKVGDKYVISGVLYNILEQNWDLDFSAVAFYVKADDQMVFATGELPVGNICDLIGDQYWDGNAEVQDQLLNSFNYGGTEDIQITGNEFVEDYTMAPLPIGIFTANQFVAAIAEEKSFALYSDITITNDALGGSFSVGAKLANDFNATIDGNGKNLTINADATGYFTGLFTNFVGTLKDANIIIWVRGAINGGHGNGVLTNYFDGIIDGCTINFTSVNGGGAYGYGYVSLLGTMGENAILQNSIINAKECYLEGGIIAENAADSCSQIINVAVVSNQLHHPRKYLGKLLPKEYVIIDGLYVTDTLDDLVAGTADYVLDADKYELWEGDSFQFAYGDGYGTDALYISGASVTIEDILGRSVERVSAPVKTNSGGAVLDALAAALNPALVEITMNSDIIAITQGDEPVALDVTALYDGVAVDPSLLSWLTDDAAVAGVAGGKVSAVGAGQTYVYASYLGVISAGCLVDVEAKVEEIATVEEFMEAMNGSLTYKLTEDIVITDKYIDTNSTYGGSNITPDFYGTLDGDGHTVTFNVNTHGWAYFNGAFRFIYGAVKNTNFVVNVTTPHNGSGNRGVFAYRVYGTVENCIINVTATNTESYGYASTFGHLGESAVIKNVVVNARSVYMAGGLIAQTAEATAKVRNVVVLSHQLGWADMMLGCLLPGNRCDIENVYTFETGSANAASSLSRATTQAGSTGYDLALDNAKYKEASVANITWTQNDCANENMEVLYGKHWSKLADVVGFSVEAYDAEILTKEGPSTLASVRFVVEA